MKKAIRFIIGAIALEYSLVAACYMDCDGAIGNVAAIRSGSSCSNVFLVGA